MTPKIGLRARVLRALAGTVFAAAWALTAGAASAAPQPLEPQPTAEALQPGLAVVYYKNFFRHIREVEEWKDYRDGKAGPPIPQLNYRVGIGNVLTSDGDDGVGAEITGLIHLAEPGFYSFAVRSNDGFRLWIGGEQILEDPDVHADRYSDIAEFQVTTPGWYPLRMLYFERKNTSTLELYWLPPSLDVDSMPLVPAEVLAHQP